jgi:hypothetical protein
MSEAETYCEDGGAKAGRWAERERVRATEGPSLARLAASARRVATGRHAGTATGQRAATVLAAMEGADG